MTYPWFPKYWVGQQVRRGFSTTPCRKPQTNLLANSVLCLWLTSSKKPSFIEWTLPYLSTQSVTLFSIALLMVLNALILRHHSHLKSNFAAQREKKQPFYLHDHYIWRLSCRSFSFFSCHEQFKFHRKLASDQPGANSGQTPYPVSIKDIPSTHFTENHSWGFSKEQFSPYKYSISTFLNALGKKTW